MTLPFELPDPQRPSTWRTFPGTCDNCRSFCCELPVEVTLTDLIRLELTPPLIDESEIKALVKSLKAKRIISHYSPKTKIFILEQREGKACIYLTRDRRCSVYEKRPETCRNFPKVGPNPGLCPAAKRR